MSRLRPSRGPWEVWNLPCTTREEWLETCAQLWDSIPEKRRVKHPMIVTSGKGKRMKIVALFCPTKAAVHNAGLTAIAPELMKHYRNPLWAFACKVMRTDVGGAEIVWSLPDWAMSLGCAEPQPPADDEAKRPGASENERSKVNGEKEQQETTTTPTQEKK